jgi:hypothetical protein
MDEPFSALQRSLLPMFQFEAMRNGKYSFPEVQRLQTALIEYNPRSKQSFFELLKAIKEALPYIEKWRINFSKIILEMDSLAKLHHLPAIDWKQLLAHPKVSHRFQFSALNHPTHEKDLASWIGHKAGKPFTELSKVELTRALLENRDKHGFSQKLDHHLKKEPEFLLNLVKHSERNFVRILNTRLIFFLTDEQLARAIVHHLPSLSQHRHKPIEQPDKLIPVLNGILSNGRSVSTLMRNTKAREILEDSGLVQPSPSLNHEPIKPSI